MMRSAISKSILSLVTIGALTATASAQDAPVTAPASVDGTPEAAPPPANVPAPPPAEASAAAPAAAPATREVESLDAAARDTSVSTIHGQLVPVGDHNQYYYKFNQFNLSTNPIGLMLGFYGLSGSYAVNQHFALKADINLYRPVDSEEDDDGFELNFSAPIYLRRMYQGFFVEPGLMVREFDSERSRTTIGPEVLLGWHWSWDSGMNVAFAFGVGRNVNADDDSSKIFPNGYLRVGYSF